MRIKRQCCFLGGGWCPNIGSEIKSQNNNGCPKNDFQWPPTPRSAQTKVRAQYFAPHSLDGILWTSYPGFCISFLKLRCEKLFSGRSSRVRFSKLEQPCVTFSGRNWMNHGAFKGVARGLLNTTMALIDLLADSAMPGRGWLQQCTFGMGNLSTPECQHTSERPVAKRPCAAAGGGSSLKSRPWGSPFEVF